MTETLPSSPRRRAGRLAAAALLGLLPLFLPATPAAAATTVLQRSCRLEGVAEPARCFELPVPENPAAPGGRQIPIQVAILPATDGVATEPPLFVLAGGPGQNARSLGPYVLRFFEKGRRTRDVVLADVRGTGGSNPLDCEMGDPLERQSMAFEDAEIQACVASLQSKADLRFYSTYHAMADLDRVREALGAPQIDLWGGSYGTRAAMVYQKLFPERTHAIVIDGVAPYEVTLPAFYAREGQRALDLLFARCAADAACHQLLPEPRQSLDTVLERLEAAPAVLTIPHPRTGQPTRLVVSRALIAGTVRLYLYSAESAASLPFLIARAEQGDYLPFAAAFVTGMESTDETMFLGFTFSVLCSEDLPFIDRAAAVKSAEGTFLGTTDLDAWTTVCKSWPRTELPADFATIPPSEVPALLLSGEIDPVVPPVWGELALGFFKNGRHLVFPGVAHNTSHVGCAGKLIDQFLKTSSARDLDPACLSHLAAPAFVTSFAGARP